MKNHLVKLAIFGGLIGFAAADVQIESGNGFLKYVSKDLSKKNKHLVLIAGDEEYRSEEAMPMLAKILAEKHGFDVSVLFSADADGTINPNAARNLSGSEALETADLIMMSIRFREWEDAAMERFVKAIEKGIPVIGLRSSTHAFNFSKKSKWTSWSWNHSTGGFGKTFLGETWVSHWGKHKSEATRAVGEAGQETNPILNGVSSVFGDSDVYEVTAPADALVLLRGWVLKDMSEQGLPAEHVKKTRAGKEQKVNDPAIPVAWTREVKNSAGTINKVLTTTMGAATDLKNEGLRRLIVNGVYWGLGMTIPEKAYVAVPDTFQPTKYSFKGFKPGLKAIDFSK